MIKEFAEELCYWIDLGYTQSALKDKMYKLVEKYSQHNLNGHQPETKASAKSEIVVSHPVKGNSDIHLDGQGGTSADTNDSDIRGDMKCKCYNCGNKLTNIKGEIKIACQIEDKEEVKTAKGFRKLIERCGLVGTKFGEEYNETNANNNG